MGAAKDRKIVLVAPTHVAREAGISSRVVRNYFQILEDTLLGFRIPPWRKSQQRRLIETEKFYWFDIGVANHLARRTPRVGSSEFGHAFENFILMEIKAWLAYRMPDLPIYYWRTASGYEVDFILGDMQAAIEIKGSKPAHDGYFRGLRALQDDFKTVKAILVCLESEPRRTADGIEIMPWQHFLEQLWNGSIIS